MLNARSFKNMPSLFLGVGQNIKLVAKLNVRLGEISGGRFLLFPEGHSGQTGAFVASRPRQS